ncbi:MAG: hypothetical protein V9H25_21235 [Candidatus Competibacter sp.]
MAVEMGVDRRLVEIRLSQPWWASTRYGESAPAPVLFEHFGFTPENVARHGAEGFAEQVSRPIFARVLFF